MPSLPRIPNPFGGVTIPAVAAQVYDDLFFASCVIDVSPSRNDPFLQLVFLNYNYDTGQFDPAGGSQTFNSGPFWTWALAPAANAANPTMRQQWLALGIELGTLELGLEAANATLATAQTAANHAATQLSQAQQQLANDQQALTAATAAQGNLAADQTALTAAQAALAASPSDPALQAAANQAQQQFNNDTLLAGNVAALTAAVNTADPAAITAAQSAVAAAAGPLTTAQAAVAAIKTQLNLQ